MATKNPRAKSQSQTNRKTGSLRAADTNSATRSSKSGLAKRSTSGAEADASKAKMSKQLQQTRDRFARVAEQAKDGDMITVEEAGLTKATKLPKAAFDAAFAATALVAEGKHARVIVVDEEISTSKAAEILGVSRPHFVALLDAGHLPYRKSSNKETAHRYVKTDDVLDYQRRRVGAHAAMDEYGAISEELGV